MIGIRPDKYRKSTEPKHDLGGEMNPKLLCRLKNVRLFLNNLLMKFVAHSHSLFADSIHNRGTFMPARLIKL